MNFKFSIPTNAWKKMAMAKKGGAVLNTTISIVEGEILTYLEKHGFSRLKKVIRDLEWPMAEVMMAVGALIREGLIEVRRDRFGVLLSPYYSR